MWPITINKDLKKIPLLIEILELLVFTSQGNVQILTFKTSVLKWFYTKLKESAKTCVWYKRSQIFMIQSWGKKQQQLTIQISITWWNGLKHSSCLYRGILFSIDNEKTVETFYDIDQSQRYQQIVKESRQKKTVYLMIPFIWNL